MMTSQYIQPDVNSYAVESRSLVNLLKPGELVRNQPGRKYRKGQIVFNEGQRAGGMYWISKGKVKLFKTGTEGRDQITQLMNSGDFIGYRELLSNEPYSVSASTLEDSELYMIPAYEFYQLLEKNTSLLMDLIRILSRDLRSAELRMMNLAQKSVRERLAETLLILRDIYGYEENSTVISVSLSREDLAAITGTATETVIRLLTDFKKESLIETQGKKIRIRDEKMLSRV